MNLRQAAQQALEAWDRWLYNECPQWELVERFDTLRAALAEPEQKVWCDCGDSIEPDSGAKCGNCVAGDSADPEQAPISLNNGRLTQYPDGRIGFGTRESVGAIGHAPTPHKPQTTHWEGCEAVHPECRKPDTDCHAQGICQRSGYSIAPTPRRPMTDEEIDAVYIGCKHGSINEFARAIEKAHGITGETK